MATATLLPTSDNSSAGTILYSSGTSAWNLLDDDDGNTNAIQFDSNGNVDMVYQDLPVALSINSVTVLGSYSVVGAPDGQVGELYVLIGGTPYLGSTNSLVVSGSYATISQVWLTNPATGLAWTPADINALKAGFKLTNYTASSTKISYLPIVVDHVALPAQVDMSRHTATFALHTLRNPEQMVKFSGILDILGTDASPLELLGEAQLWHTAGPVASGAGYENGVTTRRVVSPHVITENPNDYTADIEFKDMRASKALVWFPAYSNRNSGALEDGIPRMATPGATFTFTRATAETFTDPVGDSVTVEANVPGYASGGLLIQSGTRARFSNNSGARTWNAAQGSAGCEIYLIGALAQDRTIFYVPHDASNWAKVWYDNASGKIKFAQKVAGVTTTVTALAAASATTWYQVEVYWTGTNLENGQSAYTMALYIDRVLQATGAASGAMTEAASSTFEIGNEAGSNELRGQIRKIISRQWVPTPQEMEQAL